MASATEHIDVNCEVSAVWVAWEGMAMKLQCGASSVGGRGPAVTLTAPDIVVLNKQMAAMQQQIQSISNVVIGMATAAVAPPTSCEETRQLRHPASAALDCVDDAGVLGENHDEPFPWVLQSFTSVPLRSLVEPELKAKTWAK